MSYGRGRQKFEKKEGEFALFNNRNKKSDKSPDMTGTVMLDGREYWVSGWWKEPKAQGPDYLSCSLQSKNERREQDYQRGNDRGDRGSDRGNDRGSDNGRYREQQRERPREQPRSRPQSPQYDELNPPPQDDVPF